MEPHFALTDDQFEKQFKACTIDPAIFSHEAHLRLAYIHVSKYGIVIAEENIDRQLRAFVAHVGATGKYNKTLTIAAIKAVKHFIDKTDAIGFADLIAKAPRLKYNFKELMAYHYQTDIYQSTLAKEHFLQPDLLPFT